MTNNFISEQINKIDNIENNITRSNKYLTDLKDDLDSMSRKLHLLSDESKEKKLFGLYETINSETLLKMINSQREYTSKLINSISQISSITNNNIVDINKMIRGLLNLSQSIYTDIVINNQTSEDIYYKIEKGESSFLQQNAQYKELIKNTIERAVNDKKKYPALESRIKNLENTGLVEKNSKYIIAGFSLLAIIILGLSTYIYIKQY